MEKEFNVQIPDDVFDKLKTVGSLVNYVARATHAELPKVARIETAKEGRMSA